MSWGSKSRRGASRRANTSDHEKRAKVKEKKPLPPIRIAPSGKPHSEKKGLARYFNDHFIAARQSLLQFQQALLGNLLTSIALGLALALPAVFFVLLNNVQSVTDGWHGEPQASLFLKQSVDEDKAWQLAEKLRLHEKVAAVRYISKGEAFEGFRQFEGFEEVLAAFEQNPLPEVLVLHLDESVKDGKQIEAFVEQWEGLAEVESVQLDMEWLQRLQAMVEIVERAFYGLVVLLAMVVLMVVGNTVRLVIQEKKDEIEVGRLIGATDAFIRRPFLYSGIYYGVLAALSAWLIVLILVAMVAAPVEQLSNLYAGNIVFHGLNASEGLFLLLSGLILGLLASWVTVHRYLARVMP